MALGTVSFVFLHVEMVHGEGNLEPLPALEISENDQRLADLAPIILGQTDLDKVAPKGNGSAEIEEGPLCDQFLSASPIESHLDHGADLFYLAYDIEGVLLCLGKICREEDRERPLLGRQDACQFSGTFVKGQPLGQIRRRCYLPL